MTYTAKEMYRIDRTGSGIGELQQGEYYGKDPKSHLKIHVTKARYPTEDFMGSSGNFTVGLHQGIVQL